MGSERLTRLKAYALIVREKTMRKNTDMKEHEVLEGLVNREIWGLLCENTKRQFDMHYNQSVGFEYCPFCGERLEYHD